MSRNRFTARIRRAILLALILVGLVVGDAMAKSPPYAPAIKVERPRVGVISGGELDKRISVTVPARYASAKGVRTETDDLATARVTLSVPRARRGPLRVSATNTLRLSRPTLRSVFAHRIVLSPAASSKVRAAMGARRPSTIKIAAKVLVTRRLDLDGDRTADASRRMARRFERIRIERAQPVTDVLHGRTDSLQLAVDEFSALVAPLPDGRVVPGPMPSVSSATSALWTLLWNWERLTQAQKDALDAVLRPPTPAPARAAQSRAWAETLARGFGDVIGRRTGRPLSVPIVVWDLDRRYTTAGGTPILAFTRPVSPDRYGIFERQTFGVMHTCAIHVTLDGQALDDDAFAATLAHEVFHCWQFQVLGLEGMAAITRWLKEGSAEWAGDQMVPDEVARRRWEKWLAEPTALFARSYDAIGFYAQLASAGVDVWQEVGGILLQHADVSAFERAVAIAPHGFVPSLATSLLRRPAWGAQWDVTAQNVPTAAQARREPSPVTVSRGPAVVQPVKPVTAQAMEIDAPSGEVVGVTVTDGFGALHIPDGTRAGTTIPIDGEFSGEYCIDGECDCSFDSTVKGGDPVLAVASATSRATVTLSIKRCDGSDLGLSTGGYRLALPPHSLAPAGPATAHPDATVYWNIADGGTCHDATGRWGARGCLTIYVNRDDAKWAWRQAMLPTARTWPRTFVGERVPGWFDWNGGGPSRSVSPYTFDDALARAQAHCMALPAGSRNGAEGYWPVSERLTLTRLATERRPWSTAVVATRVQVRQVTQWAPTYDDHQPIPDHDCIPSVEVVREATLETAPADRERMERERAAGPPCKDPEHCPARPRR